MFLRALGREVGDLDHDADLIADTGASSSEGVDFAIELSDTLGVEVPNSFNPFVHPTEDRAMTLRELIEHAKQLVRDGSGGEDTR